MHMRLSFAAIASISILQIVSAFEEDFSEGWERRWTTENTFAGGMNGEFQVYNGSNSKSLFSKDGLLYIKPTLTNDIFNGYRCYDSSCPNQDPSSFVDCPNSRLWFANDQCTASDRKDCGRTYINEHKCDFSGRQIVNPIQSAAVKSKETFGYGTLEVKARVPMGDWLWPAIWMLPRHNRYGPWPRSGEIDLMETRGHVKHGDYSGASGVEFAAGTLHWGKDSSLYPKTTGSKEACDLQASTFHDDFFIYGLERTPTIVETYIKSVKTGAKVITTSVDTSQRSFCDLGNFGVKDCPWSEAPRNAPFDQGFYLILNVAVGGTNNYFPDAPNKPWKNDRERLAISDFWSSKEKWIKTWETPDPTSSALAVDWIKFTPFTEARPQVPTSTPTTVPTPSPTVTSLAPTVLPTFPPTLGPTVSPTIPPIYPPTPPSTPVPLSPTFSPTNPPTNSPAVIHTSSPTVAPSIPSLAPSTTLPTVSPPLNHIARTTTPPTVLPVANSSIPSVVPFSAPSTVSPANSSVAHYTNDSNLPPSLSSQAPFSVAATTDTPRASPTQIVVPISTPEPSGNATSSLVQTQTPVNTSAPIMPVAISQSAVSPSVHQLTSAPTPASEAVKTPDGNSC